MPVKFLEPDPFQMQMTSFFYHIVNFSCRSVSSFYEKLPADKQEDGQTDRQTPPKTNLLSGENKENVL